jgi:hypothetical protein
MISIFPLPPNKTNMLSIKNSSMLMISVSENRFVESECFLSKIRSVLAQGICIFERQIKGFGPTVFHKKEWPT